MASEKLHLRARLIFPALIRLAILGAVALGVGLMFGATAGLWFAVLVLSLLMVVYLGYLSLLGVWLDDPQLDTIPDGYGTWAEIFTRLYKSRRATVLSERRLLDNEERFRRTISALPEGILLVDAALQIEWCNPEAERHLGISLKADQGSAPDQPGARSIVRRLHDLRAVRRAAGVPAARSARLRAQRGGDRVRAGAVDRHHA
jgi:PAS domain-containing protein